MSSSLLSLALPVLTLTACLLTLPASAEDSHALYWVFLNKGGSKTPLEKEEAQRQQEAHVGNLGKLYEQGKALAAGPLGDNGFIRGTVMLTVKTPQEVTNCFLTDPFVQKNYLAVEAYRWLTDRKKIHKANVPFKIAEYTLGIVKKGPKWQSPPGEIKADRLNKLLPSLKSLTKSHDLAVSGPLLEADDKVGILLFRTPDQSRIKPVLDQDASVLSGQIVIELHPQWLGEGVFGK